MQPDLEKINIYDFICSSSSYTDQLRFGKSGETFINYSCGITDQKARVWSHKNCLIYITQGSKGYESLDHFHISQEHQVLFVRKGGFVLHQRFDKPYRALVFMFDDEFIKGLIAEYPDLLRTETGAKNAFMEQLVVIELKSSPFVKSIFLSSTDYLKEPTTESHISLEFKFKELLVNLLREKESNPFYLYLSWLCKDETAAFIKLMRDNSHFNFTTEELAKTASMSVSTFKRVFKKHFGVPPGKWLQEQRIARASAMLMNKEKSISEIAFQLGYSDVAAFSKAFKHSTNTNPSDYSKRHLVELK